MIYINASETGLNAGLGKSKFLKKLQIKKIAKQISIKNAVKVAKFAAPLVPVGGGVASKIIDSKIGRTAVKIGKSRVGRAVLDTAGVKLPDSIAKITPVTMPVKKKKGFLPKKKANAALKKTIAIKQKVIATKPKRKFPVKLKKKTKTLAIGSKGADVKVLQEQLGVEPDGDFGPKTQQALEQATGKTTISAEAVQTPVQPMDEVPQGEITAVKPYEELPETQGITEGAAATPKNNSLLMVGGAVALAGIAYLATKKK